MGLIVAAIVRAILARLMALAYGRRLINIKL